MKFQVSGSNLARWVVNFNNGNVNNNHQNNNACVRAVRASECQCNEPVTLNQIHTAWLAARAGKKPSANQLAFDSDWSSNLLELQRLINSYRWQPSPSNCFIATRPKAREIHAPDFSDRVVHHWLVPQLESLWRPVFIHDSYANQVGKGSHAAVDRLQKFVRQQPSAHYLQLDIHNFFNSIHRPTLWSLLKNKLQKANVSKQVLHTTHALLKSHPLTAGVSYRGHQAERDAVPAHKRLENSASGCGLPIGNLSSQFFANVYLNELDQFVKRHLKAKRYIRYVDDFVLVHQDKGQLAEWLVQIEAFIAHKLLLRLKDDIRLRPLSDGVDFLGYVVRPTHTVTRHRVVAHFHEALAKWEAKHVRDQTIIATPAEYRRIKSVIASYAGHIKRGCSLQLLNRVARRYPWISAVSVNHKFDYRLEGQSVEIRINKEIA